MFTNFETGSYFELLVEYRAAEDIFVYFDNVTYQSGFYCTANALIPLNATGNDSSVSLELVQAWPVDLHEAVDGYYIRASVDDVLANNDNTTIEDGPTYNISDGTVSSKIIVWDTPIESNGTISFSYAPNDNVDPIVVTANITTIEAIEGEDDDGGFIPAPSLATTLAAVGVSVAVRRRYRRD